MGTVPRSALSASAASPRAGRRATERRENFPSCRSLKSRETRKSLPRPLRPAPPRPMLPARRVRGPSPGRASAASTARVTLGPLIVFRPRIDKLPPFGLPARRQSKTPSGRVRRGVSHSGAEGATAPETLRPMDRWVMTLWKAVAARCASAHRRGNRFAKREISQVTGQRGRRLEAVARRDRILAFACSSLGDRCRMS